MKFFDRIFGKKEEEVHYSPTADTVIFTKKSTRTVDDEIAATIYYNGLSIEELMDFIREHPEKVCEVNEICFGATGKALNQLAAESDEKSILELAKYGLIIVPDPDIANLPDDFYLKLSRLSNDPCDLARIADAVYTRKTKYWEEIVDHFFKTSSDISLERVTEMKRMCYFYELIPSKEEELDRKAYIQDILAIKISIACSAKRLDWADLLLEELATNKEFFKFLLEVTKFDSETEMYLLELLAQEKDESQPMSRKYLRRRHPIIYLRSMLNVLAKPMDEQ